jgi:alkyldihydroxyacetonephosphate synthase
MAEAFYGAFFPDWESGVEAARTIAQARVRLSMLRLSDAQETETSLALTGHERLIKLADWGLRILGHGSGRCLMIYGLTGDPLKIRRTHAQAKEIFRAHGGLPTGTYIGRTWDRSRYRSPYLRNTLWDRGYALDTLETAVSWSSFARLRNAVLSSLGQAFEALSIRALIFSHLSHLYEDGVSFYLTYLYPRQPDPEHSLEIWKKAKHAASKAIVDEGGTISHQHGIGVDHLDYLAAEKSPIGMELLNQLVRSCDPDQILNPGKLLPKGAS